MTKLREGEQVISRKREVAVETGLGSGSCVRYHLANMAAIFRDGMDDGHILAYNYAADFIRAGHPLLDHRLNMVQTSAIQFMREVVKDWVGIQARQGDIDLESIKRFIRYCADITGVALDIDEW